MIHTVEGNTSQGSTLVANGGGVAKKMYKEDYSRIAEIYRPRYKDDEANLVVIEALKYVGYLEKKSNKSLKYFKKNAGYKNYNLFAYHAYKETKNGVYVNGAPWCDMFVDDMFIRALGKKRANVLLGGWSAYTPTSAAFLKNAGAKRLAHFENAKFGDIIFFKDSKGGICHIGIVITGFGVHDKDITVKKQKYTQRDFIEDVIKITKAKNKKQALNKTVTLSVNKNRKHALVLPVQKYLKSLGYYKGVCDRDFGLQTSRAVYQYQREVLKYGVCDNEVTAKKGMWQKMLGE